MPEEPNPKLYHGYAAAPPTRVAPCALDYAELDVVTNFSFLRGASHADELVYTAAQLGYRAIAVTDLHSLAGIVRAHEAAKKCGLKLIIGSRLILTDGPDLLVWATDRASYGRLCRLLTLGKRRAGKAQCILSLDDFLEHGDGLLAAVSPAMIACGFANGRASVRETASDGDARLADCLDRLRDALGNRLSLAVSRLYGADDETHVRRLHELSRDFDIPLLATNHVHYHDPGRRTLQDVLTCIRHNCAIHEAGFKLFPNGERYLKSPDQMHRLFAEHPRAIRRGVEIAERCTFDLGELKYQYPDEVVPPGKSMSDHLRELTWAGAVERYPQGIPDKVRDSLQHELKFIEGSKYEPYFLTVHDLVRFAKSKHILCQGRGSAANSAVCYCLGVTAVDPSKFKLVFERFASAERDEPPDIDIDFEHERREEVIQYIYQKYGRERAGMTAVVITYRGKSAVRDVGKTLGLGPDLLDVIASKIDWWHAGKISEEQLREAGADSGNQIIRLLVRLSGELLGFPRHLSQHVGGMVITRGVLCELVPIENASMKDRTVIEWDKDDIDTLRILKVDVLALGMLTCISKALALLNHRARQTPPLQLYSIPDEDPAVYGMIRNADTVGVFQVESRAQMSMLPRLRPEKFYDLVVEVAIVRPGPIQGKMVHPYLQQRECKRENPNYEVHYPKEELRDVLEQTLGIPLFQEQAMRMAIVAARFTPGEADQLRRSMGAWRRTAGVHQFHEKFVNGMTGRGYASDFAERCFQQISGFGEYGFPESHAASFAILVYASAWLKRYHPAAFAVATLNSQPMGFYAPAQIVGDVREHGVEVREADVNESKWDCSLEFSPCRGDACVALVAGTDERRATQASPLQVLPSAWGHSGPAMRLGFRQIKGMRNDFANRIVATRNLHGRFSSVGQFHRLTHLPVSALRRLAEADTFSSLGLSRRQALWEVMALKDDDAPLFDVPPDDPVPQLPIMPAGQEVMTDYAMTGLSLKNHPLALLREKLSTMKILPAEKANQMPAGRWVKVAGLVLVRQRPGTAAGIVFETLEDETGIVNLILRPDIYDRYRPAARHATLLQAEGYIERQGQVVHIMAKRLFDLTKMIEGLECRSRDFH